MARQLRKAQSKDGSIDVEKLTELVSAAYREADISRQLEARAQETMADELTELSAKVVAQASERFEQLLRGVRDGVLVCDANGRVITVNTAGEELFGASEASLLGRHFEALLTIDADVRTQLPAIGGSIQRSDGTVLSVEVTVSETSLSADFASIYIVRDVTARRQAEQELKVSRAFLSSVIDEIPNGIVTRAADGRIVQWNRAASRIFGASASTAIGQPLAGMVPAEVLGAGLDVRVANALSVVGLPSAQWRRADGREVHLDGRAVPLFGEDGDISHVILIFDDVSEKRQAEKRLEERRMMLRASQALARLGSWAIDVTTGSSVWSDEMYELLGLPPDTTPTKELYLGSAAPADVPSLERALAALTRGEPSAIEHRLVASDGSTKYVTLHGAVLQCDESGAPLTVLATIQDISARKRDEETLRIAKEQAEAANKAKSEFLATMSHEIRTPMSGVLGMTSLLLDTTLDEKQSRYAGNIKVCAQNLLTIINDILDVAKVEAGHFTLEVSDLDLRAVSRAVVDVLKPRADEKSIALGLVISPNVPAVVRGDAGRVRQVLMNLVGNATKFTDVGSVVVHVDRKTTLGAEDVIRFEVMDSGPGIPEASQSLLFREFVQIDGSATRKHGGTGLGLAISRKLVELMGGRIGVVSAEGSGSTFWFELPAEVVAESECEDLSCNGPHSNRGAKQVEERAHVLVVDDNPINQEVARGYLENQGYRVSVASNGVEALKMVQSIVFDVVLMDMQMPEMDGLTATRTIREKGGALAKLPIIMLSANAMESDRARGLEAGATDYLAKPVNRSELLAAVRHHVSNVIEMEKRTRSSTTAQLALVDVDAFIGLVDAIGVNRAQALLETARERTLAQLEELEAKCKAGDHAAVSAIAHGLKGSMGTLGLQSASKMAAALEQSHPPEPLVLIQSLREVIKDGLLRLQSALLAKAS